MGVTLRPGIPPASSSTADLPTTTTRLGHLLQDLQLGLAACKQGLREEEGEEEEEKERLQWSCQRLVSGTDQDGAMTADLPISLPAYLAIHLSLLISLSAAVGVHSSAIRSMETTGQTLDLSSLPPTSLSTITMDPFYGLMNEDDGSTSSHAVGAGFLRQKIVRSRMGGPTPCNWRHVGE